LSGFIGLPVAQAYVRAGHIVYGQTRSQASAVDLAAEEIIPVICDPYTDEGRAAWGKIAAQVDVCEWLGYALLALDS
jgi:nucleoside-diphosphate-sugar epimerase